MLQALDAAVRADLRMPANHPRQRHRRAARPRRRDAAQGHARERVPARRVERGRRGRHRGGARVIPDDVVERVREEADIVAIVGEYVKLKRVGNSFRGPCPFHHGKNDNFSVTPQGGYKCFVCGESGDVFTFVAEAPRSGFRRGGEVGRRQERASRCARSRRARDERDPREPLWEVNARRRGVLPRRSSGSRDHGAGGARLSGVARPLARRRRPLRRSATRRAIAAAMRDALAALGFDDERQLSRRPARRRARTSPSRVRVFATG